MDWWAASLLAGILLVFPGLAAANEDYAAAIEAQQAGDCPGMVGHLERFLAGHPEIADSHRDFYLQVRIVMDQCAGELHVSGADEDSVAIDPLPTLPTDGG
ncbi:hypothetical protein DEA8626_03373 [Defluviimonas aquaemixtae]|uniref:Uncharacterized protein n=1 Tax=Albidovulum aquaemixtae TaxID=1542388 RepID=A0A2R8BLM9_9RHOB|nr:hypothetical protein [Defluviimonas aquaemixtae]SPH24322.1 hypothetical protein DEA8626_03373 [Defluviimonas aquaemixtae]